MCRDFENIENVRAELNSILSDLMEKSERFIHRQAGVLYLGENFVLAENGRLADYYLGFEYIESECVLSIGEAKAYFDCERVDSFLEVMKAEENT